MDLKITDYNNFYSLKGHLNRENVHRFQKKFRHIFDKVNAITLSVEGIESMDRYGLNAIVALHKESITKNKSLAIIGVGCKELYDHFHSEAA